MTAAVAKAGPAVVKLEWFEVAAAVTVGVQRHLASLRRGSRDAHGWTGRDGWGDHIEGACGERAAAKAMGLYWDGSVNVFERSDLVGRDGVGIQVKTRSKDEWDLIVRPGDSDAQRFVLVTGTVPTYRVWGWILGRDAKRSQWAVDYGNRPTAYFVPKDALRPVGAMG